MRTCRAIVFNGDGTYAERAFPIPIPIPDPVPGRAVVRAEAVGLCGSGITQFHGHRHVLGEIWPVVPGHETGGRTQALASDADFGVELGQRVAVGPSVPNPEKKMGLDLSQGGASAVMDMTPEVTQHAHYEAVIAPEWTRLDARDPRPRR